MMMMLMMMIRRRLLIAPTDTMAIGARIGVGYVVGCEYSTYRSDGDDSLG
jgi:hypothetical protein